MEQISPFTMNLNRSTFSNAIMISSCRRDQLTEVGFIKKMRNDIWLVDSKVSKWFRWLPNTAFVESILETMKKGSINDQRPRMYCSTFKQIWSFCATSILQMRQHDEITLSRNAGVWDTSQARRRVRLIRLMLLDAWITISKLNGIACF